MARRAPLTNRHPATRNLLRWFDYDHLPVLSAAVSMPFAELADHLCDELPDSAELSACLRKLLEAKDCAVRAAIEAGER